MKTKLKEAVTTHNDRLSQSKIWANIGSGVASWAFIYLTLHDKLSWEIFVVYLGSVCGFTQVSKWLSYKYGGPQYVDNTDNASQKDTIQKPSKPSKSNESDELEPGD